MAHINLEFGQAGGQKQTDSQCDHLRIRINALVSDQLGAHLGGFLHPSLKTGIVNENISRIGKTHGEIFFMEIFAHGPGDRRGNIRPENQRIAFSVEKFVHLVRWQGTLVLIENIKKFKGRCLDIPVTIGFQDTFHAFGQTVFTGTFPIINIAYPFRCMYKSFFHF